MLSQDLFRKKKVHYGFRYLSVIVSEPNANFLAPPYFLNVLVLDLWNQSHFLKPKQNGPR